MGGLVYGMCTGGCGQEGVQTRDVGGSVSLSLPNVGVIGYHH